MNKEQFDSKISTLIELTQNVDQKTTKVVCACLLFIAEILWDISCDTDSIKNNTDL